MVCVTLPVTSSEPCQKRLFTNLKTVHYAKISIKLSIWKQKYCILIVFGFTINCTAEQFLKIQTHSLCFELHETRLMYLLVSILEVQLLYNNLNISICRRFQQLLQQNIFQQFLEQNICQQFLQQNISKQHF